MSLSFLDDLHLLYLYTSAKKLDVPIFLDDVHLPFRRARTTPSWIYLSFLDDLHRQNEIQLLRISWMYLSFLDDLHPIQLK